MGSWRGDCQALPWHLGPAESLSLDSDLQHFSFRCYKGPGHLPGGCCLKSTQKKGFLRSAKSGIVIHM